MKSRSTARAIFQLVEDVIEALNSGKCVAGVFLDLSKAFDSVDHAKLLSKLERCGFRGHGYDLIKSYLTGRRQRVQSLDECTGEFKTSPWGIIKRGVPQGSTLGPVLFLLYINDLPENILYKVVMFADDNTLCIRGNSNAELQHKIEDGLSAVQTYYFENSLKLNFDKTKIIKFSTTSDEKIQVVAAQNKLTSSVDTKFLGIFIDNKVNWKSHINHLVPKVSSFCYALRVLSQSVDQSVSLTAYYAYVYSRIRYGIIFWGNSTEAPRMFVLQKKCIRIIFHLSPLESCKQIFIANKILTFTCIYILESVCFVKENYIMFLKYEHSHIHNTRQKHSLRPIKTNLTMVQKSVVGQLIKMYNYLPAPIKNLDIKPFKQTVKGILMEKAYYSLDEYFTDTI